ncbi:MAG: response regulator [Methylacidiphilales bacterium]|nr:response regulator [Candidatus Methylacidiphilales bacterium]
MSTITQTERPVSRVDLKSYDFTGYRILVIDDNDGVLFSLQKCLHELGAWVTTAASGRDGLELLDLEPFHLIILDIMMPKPDGWDIFVKLRRSDRHKTLPVVFLTGLISVPQSNFLNKGYSEYCRIVTKGEPMQRLVGVIHDLLGSCAQSPASSH